MVRVVAVERPFRVLELTALAEEAGQPRREDRVVGAVRAHHAELRDLPTELVRVEVRAVRARVHPEPVLDPHEGFVDRLHLRGDHRELVPPPIGQRERALVAVVVVEVGGRVLGDGPQLDLGLELVEIVVAFAEVDVAGDAHDVVHGAVPELRRVEAIVVAEAVLGVDVEGLLHQRGDRVDLGTGARDHPHPAEIRDVAQRIVVLGILADDLVDEAGRALDPPR